MSNFVTFQLKIYQNITRNFIVNANSAGMHWKSGSEVSLDMACSIFFCFPFAFRQHVWFRQFATQLCLDTADSPSPRECLYAVLEFLLARLQLQVEDNPVWPKNSFSPSVIDRIHTDIHRPNWGDFQ